MNSRFDALPNPDVFRFAVDGAEGAVAPFAIPVLMPSPLAAHWQSTGGHGFQPEALAEALARPGGMAHPNGKVSLYLLPHMVCVSTLGRLVTATARATLAQGMLQDQLGMASSRLPAQLPQLLPTQDFLGTGVAFIVGAQISPGSCAGAAELPLPHWWRLSGGRSALLASLNAPIMTKRLAIPDRALVGCPVPVPTALLNGLTALLAAPSGLGLPPPRVMRESDDVVTIGFGDETAAPLLRLSQSAVGMHNIKLLTTLASVLHRGSGAHRHSMQTEPGGP